MEGEGEGGHEEGHRDESRGARRDVEGLREQGASLTHMPTASMYVFGHKTVCQ